MEAACGRAGTGLPLTGGIEGGRRGAVLGGVSSRGRIHPEQIYRGHSPESGKLSPLCAAGLCRRVEMGNMMQRLCLE